MDKSERPPLQTEHSILPIAEPPSVPPQSARSKYQHQRPIPCRRRVARDRNLSRRIRNLCPEYADRVRSQRRPWPDVQMGDLLVNRLMSVKPAASACAVPFIALFAVWDRWCFTSHVEPP